MSNDIANAIERREITDFPGYTVTSEGTVYNRWNRPLAPNINNTGVVFVRLFRDGRPHTKPVHCLVAQAYLDNPKNLPCVGHIDHDYKNNAVDNLYWTTHGDAIRRSFAEDRHPSGNPVIVHAVNPVTGEKLKFKSMREAERFMWTKFGVKSCHVAIRNSIKAGKEYKGYLWKIIKNS